MKPFYNKQGFIGLAALFSVYAAWDADTYFDPDIPEIDIEPEEVIIYRHREDHSLDCAADLSVLSYNIRALPPPFDARGDSSKTFDNIGERLAARKADGTAPDIILIQEGYSEDFAGRVRRRADYPYVVTQIPEKDNFITRWMVEGNATGMEIYSKYPLRAIESEQFENSDIVESLANKSIVSATIEKPDIPFPVQILTTHYQAEWKHDAIRQNQVAQTRDFLSRINFGVNPAVFAGDFNFKPRRPSYAYFQSILPPFQDSGAFCLVNTDVCTIDVNRHGKTDINDVWRSTNDRHFYHVPEDKNISVTPVYLTRNFTEHAAGGYRENGHENLSDHWGYEVKYRISWACSDYPQTQTPPVLAANNP